MHCHDASLPTYTLDTADYPQPYKPAKLEPVRTAPLPYSAPVPGTPAIKDQTPPFRHPDFINKDLICTPHDDSSVTTTFHLLKRARDKWPNRPAMGTRKVLNVREVEKENGKKWTVWDLGDYEYLTFAQLYEEAVTLGCGLSCLAMAVEEGGGGVGGGDEKRVGIYMQTCEKWMQTCLAAASQALTVVTAYDTLGGKALGYSLRETDCSVLLTEGRLLSVLLEEGILDMIIGTVRHIVYTTDYGKPKDLDEVMESIKDKSRRTISFLSWKEFRELGIIQRNRSQQMSYDEQRTRIPSADDYCCIMYTSGSTGPPKGVLLKHKAVIAGISAANYMVAKWLTPQDRFLAYLPLAHIVEFELEHVSLFSGACLGYGRPQTLTPAAGSLEKGCKGDIEIFKPTILIGVPQVWETIKKGITRMVDSSGFLTKTLFHNALTFRMWAYGGSGTENPVLPASPLTRLAVSLIDWVVFSQIRSALGGHLRAGLNGAAKLNRNTSDWLTHVLGAPIVKGYAMTETTALLTFMPPDQFNTMSEGQIAPSAEIKLVSYPEAGYSVLDEPNPRGEIWVRGICVTEGYYSTYPDAGDNTKQHQSIKFDDAFFLDPEDRHMWFRTGDIGEIELFPSSACRSTFNSPSSQQTYGGDPARSWSPFSSSSGHLRIIDRKKNLLKTSRGEYIAVEKLESVYRSSPVVSQIVVFVRDDMPKPVALVHPVEGYLRKSVALKTGVGAEEEGIMSLDDLVRLPGIRKGVLKEIQRVGRESGLIGAEIVDGIALVGGEEWTVETGLITGARKVVRREVEKRFKKELEEAWKALEGR